MAEYDLVIRGGFVVDGSGTPGREADIGIKDGRVASVGDVVGSGAEEIDAQGKLVAPGFVDIHTHYDGQVTWGQALSPSSNHGVTTAIMGNCGVGFAPVRDVDHDTFDARDGQTFGVDADLGRFGIGGRFERVFGVGFRFDAAADEESFWFYRAGVGGFRELPLAIGLYVQPSLSYQRFDGASAADPEAREDLEAEVLFRVSKRDWRVFSAAPFVSVEVSQRESNLDRLDTTETAFQAGFTRSF